MRCLVTIELLFLLVLPLRADPIVSFDLGNGALYTGGGPADPSGTNTWTSAPGPGEGPFTDPNTGIGLRVYNGSTYVNTAASGVPALFNDFVVDTSGGGAGIQSANWELTGLNDALLYDVYFIAPNGQQFAAGNVYGAVYDAQSQSAAASGALNTFGGWVEGENYAVLRNLASSGGTIAGTYNENPASLNPNNFGIAGVQVVAVPEPTAAALLAAGALALYGFRRRCPTIGCE